MTLRIIPAIMSGGAGTRLWPLSTEDHPKQFHALMGPRTMFAETVARVSGSVADIIFASPIVLCGEKHVARVRAALSEVNAHASAVVIEPAARNTAAVAAAAAAVAGEIDTDALVLLLPSDHVVARTPAFHAAIERGAPYAKEHIVTFGISPRDPSTAYGYIKSGAELGDGVFAVEAFKEKPDATTAQSYIRAGGYTWNSGIFLFNPRTLRAEFGAHGGIRDNALASVKSAVRDREQIRLGGEYASATALPLDIAVMEHTARAAVVQCDIGWADVGSWSEVWRLAPRDANGFAVLGPAASADTSKMTESGVKAEAHDGENLVVVAARHGLLILPRTLSADVTALKALEAKLA